MSACAGGGASDIVGAGRGRQRAARERQHRQPVRLRRAQAGLRQADPGLPRDRAGKGVQFQQSYGASGDQSRKVEAGAERRLRQLLGRARHHPPGRCRAGRQGLERQRAPRDPVRLGRDHRRAQGQPQGHQGLGRPPPAGPRGRDPQPVQLGLGEVEPAGPVRRQEQGRKRQEGRAGLHLLARQGHVKTQPKSGREATEAFLQGCGDALLSYENEAMFIERAGEPVEYVTPPQTFKIENPVAVLSQERRTPRCEGVQRLPLHAGGAAALGPGRLPPGRPDGRRRSSPRDFPAREALDDRRPRRLEGRQRPLFKKDVGYIAIIYDRPPSRR